MDPLKMIAKLEADRADLKAALLQPGIGEGERIAIRRQISSFSNEIAARTSVCVVPHPFNAWEALQSGFVQAGCSTMFGGAGTAVASAIGMPWAQAKLAGFAVGALKFLQSQCNA